MTNTQECESCYKIVCKQCGWEADEQAVTQIQKGEMNACPECGGKPS